MVSEEPQDVGSALQSDPFEGTSYRAVRRLGGGGMGEVFVVEHRQIGRRFAAKALRGERVENAQAIDRVRLEAQALARLSHPNIVTVVDFAKTPGGRPFIVMELLRGRTLAEALEDRDALPVTVAVAYVMELLSALDATHGIGVVHRDVKPSNLFLATQIDGSIKLKLIDFGIVRVLPEAPASAPAPLAVPTATGEIVGTPRYSSPEGAAGARVDGRGDVYATALVLYTMLAGRGPFDELHGAGPLRAAHARQRPEPPSHFAREPIPAELDELVLHALEKDPSARCATAAELRAQLATIAELLARPAGWLATTAFSRERSAAKWAEATSEPNGDRPQRPAIRGAYGWILFGIGIVIAALAVAALGRFFGGSR